MLLFDAQSTAVRGNFICAAKIFRMIKEKLDKWEKQAYFALGKLLI